MDISEVARRAGLPASTLRYYEERGLIAAVGRNGLRRRFAPAVLDRLALVALGRAAGLSLGEIRSMILPDGQPSIDRQLLAAKADEIDATVERLKTMSRGLRHAARCPAQRHAECPTFQRLLRAAAEGSLAQHGDGGEAWSRRSGGADPVPESTKNPKPPLRRRAGAGPGATGPQR